ncbi:MAG: hypothetical protein ABR525_02095 [Candidatus Limnocylindria bacterium]
MDRASTRPFLAMFAALWLGYALVGIWTTARISATGDEPFYLMAADALVHGEGFDMSERFESIAASSYAPDPPLSRERFLAQTAPSVGGDGRFPLHDLGLSLLIAAPFVLGGRALVAALLAGAMAAAVVLGVRAARELGVSRGAAFVGGSLTALAAPALTYSGQVFPDALAALPVAVALCALVGSLPRAWLGLSVAVLPVLHLRFWPLAVGLLFAAFMFGKMSRSDLPRQLLPLVAVVTAIAAIDGLVYGLPVPHAGFLLFFREGAAGPVAAYTAHDAGGVLGLFFDRSRGLVAAAPIAMLAFAGAGALTAGRLGRSLLLGIVPYLVAVSLLDWTGAYSPHARYLAPLVAILVAAISGGVARAPLAACLLGAWTVFQSGIYVVAAELRYDRLGAVPLADQVWTGILGFAPSALFPVVGRDEAQMTGAVLAAGILFLAGAWRHPSRSFLFRRSVA